MRKNLFLVTLLFLFTVQALCCKAQGSRSMQKEISLDPAWQYAEFSKINSGNAVLYLSKSPAPKNFTVCVNAGHGTKDGEKVQTLSHPDGSAKVTGGSTKKGSITSTAVSVGMTFKDGTPEAEATLSLALILKAMLLEEGYNVLMIRETDDVQLDNIARTVIANNCANCHIALHYDSSSADKGMFFCAVPKDQNYRLMEPVKTHHKEHLLLGKAIVNAAQKNGVKVFQKNLEVDLTQTSYSTIPSIDLEVGDSASNHSKKEQTFIAKSIVNGINSFYSKAEK